MHDVLDVKDLLADEFVQRREAGYEVAELEGPIKNALANGTVSECERLLERLGKTSRRGDWSYKEPSTLEEIMQRWLTFTCEERHLR